MRLKPPLQLHAVRLRGLPRPQPSGYPHQHRALGSAAAPCTGTTMRRRCPRRRAVCRC